MGYQESFIYTSRFNVAANNRDIEALLNLFQKYGIRCTDDLWAECVCKLHFNARVCGFKAGMEMLVISGERCVQKSKNSLTGYRVPHGNIPLVLEKDEAALINRVKILFIESAMQICAAETTVLITVDQLSLQPRSKTS